MMLGAFVAFGVALSFLLDDFLIGEVTNVLTLEELNDNLKEVVAMLLDDGEPAMESEFIGTQTVVVA